MFYEHSHQIKISNSSLFDLLNGETTLAKKKSQHVRCALIAFLYIRCI